MRKLAPGIPFIGALSIKVLGFLGIAYGTLYTLERYIGISVPVPLNTVAVISLCSAYPIARIIWKFRTQRRQASELDAKLVPEVKGKWLGNVDVTLDFAKAIDVDYVGEHDCFRSFASSSYILFVFTRRAGPAHGREIWDYFQIAFHVDGYYLDH